ncbi:DUF5677 domain-containing protein [Neoroseomonas lacus]|uniref:Uncharacterized protein n=1 Tax=Neoroseomonas lacus TaxID=287609 RepID=A0A917KQL0_9PROT|nr:DUF5677 domain-containing protein [Neoroseomonas lacus]GGJ25228.1 hypothetical protein GCM10011320_35750 [Neoroseomonas lacus]
MPSDPHPPPVDPAEVERLRAYLSLLPEAHAACVGMMEAIGGTDLNAFPVPKQAAFGLIARSIGNLEAIDLLLKTEQIVEARTITRCLVENLFMVGSIHARPDMTMSVLENDFAKSRIVRAGILLERGADVLDPDQLDRLQAFAADLKQQKPKNAYIRQKALADDTYAAASLAIYSQLSDDSAHATLASLGRHIRLQQSGTRELVQFPEPSVAEACHTAATATNMTIGLLLGVRDIFGGALGEPHIARLEAAFRAAKERWPPRPGTLDPT